MRSRKHLEGGSGMFELAPLAFISLLRCRGALLRLLPRRRKVQLLQLLLRLGGLLLLNLGLLRHEGAEDAVVERHVLGGAPVHATGLLQVDKFQSHCIF